MTDVVISLTLSDVLFFQGVWWQGTEDNQLLLARVPDDKTRASYVLNVANKVFYARYHCSTRIIFSWKHPTLHGGHSGGWETIHVSQHGFSLGCTCTSCFINGSSVNGGVELSQKLNHN